MLVSNGGYITVQSSGTLGKGIQGVGTVTSQITLNGGSMNISTTGMLNFGVDNAELTVKDSCEITVSDGGNIYPIHNYRYCGYQRIMKKLIIPV